MPSILYELPDDAMPTLQENGLQFTETEISCILDELNKSYHIFCEQGKGTFLIRTPLAYYESPLECEFELVQNPANMRDPSVMLTITRAISVHQEVDGPQPDVPACRSRIVRASAMRISQNPISQEHEPPSPALDAALKLILRERDREEVAVLSLLGDMFIRLCQSGEHREIASEDIRLLKDIAGRYSDLSFLGNLNRISIEYNAPRHKDSNINEGKRS